VYLPVRRAKTVRLSSKPLTPATCVTFLPPQPSSSLSPSLGLGLTIIPILIFSCIPSLILRAVKNKCLEKMAIYFGFTWRQGTIVPSSPYTPSSATSTAISVIPEKKKSKSWTKILCHKNYCLEIWAHKRWRQRQQQRWSRLPTKKG